MIAPRRVVLLGASGSIGDSAAKVARAIPDRMQIVALSAHRNATRLAELAREFNVRAVAIGERAEDLRRDLPHAQVFSGPDALTELATLPEADLVLIAIVGTAGLRPALAAIEAGKDIAIASKEILVMAGAIVMRAARKRGVRVLPVDSEHNAIFQCLENRPPEHVRRLILTASGGPFRTWPVEKLATVTPEQALQHPTWTMGAKITIDSASLFNKGLEMIEARWLFDVPMDRIEVVVHPQSVVHSMVEFIDGSLLAQLSRSDMCFPIQYAVTWPDRVAGSLAPLDWSTTSRLEFEPPRTGDFPALDLARRAGETCGAMPAVLNAANEVAVAAFLDRKLPFPGIWEIVAATMDAFRPVADPDLAAIVAADDWARSFATNLVMASAQIRTVPAGSS
jgi:1-deoxy-D-xylulose-5-phosphate reductoisomerase